MVFVCRENDLIAIVEPVSVSSIEFQMCLKPHTRCMMKCFKHNTKFYTQHTLKTQV
ncbi:hypothetical protein HanRHA438_Chr09g0426831 [Helianthus annuus]|nr:hypothetical protein HanHA89_Chr09g0362051 [Helianthus annuus]KAJ0709476.1 hypothetical protein HanLR1_Chr09g0340801 [Helianthus annuus]KAJ0890706.1 hypothetical protein HanRHA438_Chr09g0426831 [Helianthus annuus]